MKVDVVTDSDPTLVGCNDFVRVCSGHEDGCDCEHTVIERVFACVGHNKVSWQTRTLLETDELEGDTALQLAVQYASAKGIPVVYAEGSAAPRRR